MKKFKLYNKIITDIEKGVFYYEIINEEKDSNNEFIVYITPIEIEDISGAHYSKDSGKLVWDLEIAGGATKKLKLVYSVKYPKEKKIGNL